MADKQHTVKVKVEKQDSQQATTIGERLASGFKRMLNPDQKGGGALGALIGGQAGVGSLLKQAGGIAGEALGGPLGAIAGGKVGDELAKIFDTIVNFPQKFMQVAGQIASYVSAANPQVVERFNLAAKDMTAIFGHGLSPAMEMFTDMIRSVADGLASSDLIGSMKGLFGELRDQFRELQPAISLAVKNFADVVSSFIRMTTWAVKLAGAINQLPWIAQIGKKMGGGRLNGASVGMAAQSASMMGAEEYSRAATIAAYSTGVDPAARTADATEQTVGLLNDVLNVLQMGNGPMGVGVLGRIFGGG